MNDFIDTVFEGSDELGPEGPRFVEVEDSHRHSISLGEWIKRDDGFWVLRVKKGELK